MKLYYLVAIITLVSAVLGVAFSINAVGKETDARRTSALYMLARSLALMIVAIIPICYETKNILVIITIAMLIVQIVDCFVGIYIKHRMRIIGPFIMAVAHIICLGLLTLRGSL